MSSDLEKKIMENENQDGNQDPQSPEKTTLVETLLKICDEMRGTRKLITTEVCKLESKLSEKITQETQKVNDNIDEKLAPLLADVEELKVRVDTCEEKISGLKEGNEREKKDHEKERRRKNIVIRGFKIEEGSNQISQVVAQVIKLFQDKLGIRLSEDQIDFTKVVGKERKGPIIMGLTSWNKKVEIFKNAHKLKGSSIYIGEDFPPEVINIRKTLIPEMIKHRKEGRHAIIKYDQLVVERKPVLQPSTTRVASYDREIPPEVMDISESENEVDTQESQDEEKEEGKKKKQNTSPDLAFQSVRINSDQGRKKLKLTKKKVLAMRQANLNGYIQSGSKPNNNGEKEEKINKEREKDKNQGKEENIIPVNNPSSSKTKQ
ncbi:hypothetical protein M8J77_003483 [Diaphorina citri]|nr:hypothetical protein M8J77_003483 [Diaphorina citri]